MADLDLIAYGRHASGLSIPDYCIIHIPYVTIDYILHVLLSDPRKTEVVDKLGGWSCVPY